MHVRSGLIVLLAVLICALCAPLLAQNGGQMSYAPLSTTKFMSLPVLPACATFAAQRGDPMKGAAVLLLKLTTGCVIPWHWHTASESLMMVSGKGKVQMKPIDTHTLYPGDFLYLPGKEVHEFTCLSSCLLYDVTDGAFDIHYVKASMGRKFRRTRP